jgi:hypothetical protein
VKKVIASVKALGILQFLSQDFHAAVLSSFETIVLNTTDNPPATIYEHSLSFSFDHFLQSILHPWLKAIGELKQFSDLRAEALAKFLAFRIRHLEPVMKAFPHSKAALDDLKFIFDQLGPSFNFLEFMEKYIIENVKSAWIEKASLLTMQKNVLEACIQDMCKYFRCFSILDKSGYLAHSLLEPLSQIIKKSNHSNIVVAQYLFEKKNNAVLFPEEYFRDSSSSLLQKSMQNIQQLKKIRLQNSSHLEDPAVTEVYDHEELSWRPMPILPIPKFSIPEYYKQGDLILFLIHLAKSKMILFESIQTAFGRCLLDPLVPKTFLLEVNSYENFL